jgi:hypothetical protein
MIRERQIYPHGNDQGCYKLISDWLADCVSGHPHCRTSKNLALPTRLLDVGDQGNDSIFSLVSSNGLSDKYLALSYCWGPADRHPPKLLEGNLAMYEAGVPSCFLPRTFQDAFQVARGIGCRYIWIDSLCIIQDSEFDKARELAKMKDVFQNSYLTIAVADSLDTNYGMLFSRPSAESPDVQVEWQDSITRRKVTAHLRVDKSGTGDAIRNHSPEAYADGQLGQRAWTLQERLLPCRVLHYTSHQLVWECQTIRAWEGNNVVESVDDSIPEVGNDVQVIKDINLKPMIRIMKELEAWGADVIYRYWYRVLAVYSCRELSYDSDKISGISGIADQVGQYVQDRLVHGIWIKDIARGLLWSLQPPLVPRRTTLQAPSWSWAYCHGHIFDSLPVPRTGRLPKTHTRRCVNYQFRIPSANNAEIDTRGAKEGVLTITGFCRPAKLRRFEDEDFGEAAALHFYEEPALALQFAYLDGLLTLPEYPGSVYPYLCLQIGIWDQHPAEHYLSGNTRQVMGLVLAPKTETAFCRAGIFWSSLNINASEIDPTLSTRREVHIV